MTLDQRHPTRHHGPVVFNSATRFGDPSNKADTRHPGGFFTSVHRYTCVQFMAGSSGETFGSAGSLFRFANPAICLPPPFGDGWQASKNKEATMPKLPRALSRLFSRSAPVSIIRPAPSLADARRLAAELVTTGARVRIQPTSRGFDVVEVAA